MSKSLNWYSTFSQGQGYSGSSEHMALALRREGVDVSCMAFNKTPFKNLTAEGKELKSVPFKLEDVGITYGFPNQFSSMQNKFKVGYTMFETDTLPVGMSNWSGKHKNAAEAINSQLDLLLVPCKHNKDIFEDNGVRIPIEVVPLGVDPTQFSYIERPERDTFTFLMMGTLTLRKNPGNVISAFASVFKDNPDVKLVLKTQSGTLGHLQFDGMGNIEIIDRLATTEEVQQLYYDADCFLFPTRGEGFGLPPLEAMATGLPTVIADNTGMRDFSDDKYNWTVKFSHKSPAQRYPNDWGYVGSWYESDIDDLKRIMLEIYTNHQEAKIKAQNGSKWVAENWTYANTAKSLIGAIEKYYNKF